MWVKKIMEKNRSLGKTKTKNKGQIQNKTTIHTRSRPFFSSQRRPLEDFDASRKVLKAETARVLSETNPTADVVETLGRGDGCGSLVVF